MPRPQAPGTNPAQEAVMQTPGPLANHDEIYRIQLAIAERRYVDTPTDLRGKRRATIPFPPCAAELLSLIKPGTLPIRPKGATQDDIADAFADYFKFKRHHTLGQINDKPDELDQLIGTALDPALADCHGIQKDRATVRTQSQWPSDCCICQPCVTLEGYRNHPPFPADAKLPDPGIRRLFIGDALWLFFYDQMGVQQILGAILDAFAGSGRLPIPNGSLPGNTVEDNITAVILEIMVRQTKTGLSPSVRDRAMLYRTALGWNTKLGIALNVDTEINSGFSTLFHRFIYNALEFYRDRRLAVAIQSQAVPNARPSVATLVTLQNTIDVLKKRFEPFDYGRNYYNTLAGIVWTISAMSVIRQMSNTLGIPTAYGDPHEFIPAAYDLLVLKRPVTRGDVNRYSVHRDCAINGRDILLDMEVLNFQDQTILEDWLTQVERKVEAYRTAYRNLTGVDLGASPTPLVEHQVPAMA